MVYTIGNALNYRAYLKRPQGAMKIGRTDSYPGGTVWRTVEDVIKHMDENMGRSHGFAVFEVDAEWGVDTESSQEGPWHDLLRDARIIREV